MTTAPHGRMKHILVHGELVVIVHNIHDKLVEVVESSLGIPENNPHGY